MNMPNKLTVIRVLLMPFFMAAMLYTQIPHHYLFAFLIFIAACITDAVDGHLARKLDQITTFGKFLDPLADKILTTAAFLCLMQEGYCNIWVVILVLTREFLVTSVRLIAAGQGVVVAANIWGKIKTVVQMVSMGGIIFMLAVLDFGVLGWFPLSAVSHTLMWVTAAFTVISGGKYLLDNIRVFKGSLKK